MVAMKASFLLKAEKKLEETITRGTFRLAVGYPNSYHVGMSSLSHLWVHRLALNIPGISVERFYADDDLETRSLESGRPLGDFDVLAFTLSFEPDAVFLLKTLMRAGIACRREERLLRDPLIIVGGAVASINPLPLAPCVDIFCLGAAEILWPALIQKLRDSTKHEKLLEELAEEDGFFIPEFHLDPQGHPIGRRRRLEKRDRHFQEGRENVPASHIITPNTLYRQRGLIEMSRGCPEKCSYCWVSHNYGRLRSYPASSILERVDELSTLSRRIGFVATAVGDHPNLLEILRYCRSKNLQVSLSSLRIPAMKADILENLAASGARSITIAPETGNDALRASMQKRISNREILAAVDMAQQSGIEALKMYFIIGLPGEEDADVLAIVSLLREARTIMLGHEKRRGRIAGLSAGISILVPKPYTPYQKLGMISGAEARRKLKLLRKAALGLSNLRIDLPSHRMALWQSVLSRADTRAFEALMAAAQGQGIAEVLRTFPELVRKSSGMQEERPLWQFISSAPSKRLQESTTRLLHDHDTGDIKIP